MFRPRQPRWAGRTAVHSGGVDGIIKCTVGCGVTGNHNCPPWIMARCNGTCFLVCCVSHDHYLLQPAKTASIIYQEIFPPDSSFPDANLFIQKSGTECTPFLAFQFSVPCKFQGSYQFTCVKKQDYSSNKKSRFSLFFSAYSSVIDRKGSRRWTFFKF